MDVHLVVSVAAAIFSILLSLIAFFARRELEDVKARLGKTEERQQAHEVALREVSDLKLRLGKVEERQQVHDVDRARASTESMHVAQQISGVHESIGKLQHELAIRYSTREDIDAIEKKLEEMMERVIDMHSQIAVLTHVRGESVTAAGRSG